VSILSLVELVGTPSHEVHGKGGPLFDGGRGRDGTGAGTGGPFNDSTARTDVANGKEVPSRIPCSAVCAAAGAEL
jgi:hypothetical protein